MLSLARLIVYVIEGLAISLAIHLVSKKSLGLPQLATLGVTIAATFAILDLFSPTIGSSARQGSGFGLGLQQVGFGQLGGNPTPFPRKYFEGMDDKMAVDYYQRHNGVSTHFPLKQSVDSMPAPIVKHLTPEYGNPTAFDENASDYVSHPASFQKKN